MRHRLVLVNPPFQRRVRRVAQTSVGPPLGLAYLAAVARRAGHEVAIVDANALGLSFAESARRVRALAPTVVGLTATTPTVDLAGAIAAALGSGARRAPILLGGPHGTALPARTLAEQPAVDMVARGEGEATLPLLLARLDGGPLDTSALAEVPGLAFRGQGGEVVDTGVAAPIADLDSLPEPARDLLPNHRYRCPDSERFSTLLGMRGCPYRCVYCAVPGMFGRQVRFRDPGAVVAELAGAHARFGVEFFSFLDDTFTTRRAWVEAFCDAARRAGLPGQVRWICLTRADLVDRALLATMKAAGCVRIELGVESGSEAGRAFLDKGLEDGQILEAFHSAREVGLSTMGFAILNIPGETEADEARTFELLARADPDFLQVSLLTPYPGTPLRALAEERGWISTDDWARYSFLNDVVLDHGVPAATICARHRAFLRRFYLRPRTALKLGRLVLSGTTRLRPLARTVALGLTGAWGGGGER
ncbi:MAG: radical SAM protein [Pseudomonadota bacterium]